MGRESLSILHHGRYRREGCISYSLVGRRISWAKSLSREETRGKGNRLCLTKQDPILGDLGLPSKGCSLSNQEIGINDPLEHVQSRGETRSHRTLVF